MKTLKKLHVAVAAASLFVIAGQSMAASINQSGLGIAREAIPAASAAAINAPTVTFNYDNGPTANANSSQDFNVILTLGGQGDAKWAAAPTALPLGTVANTIAAFRRNNGNTIVEVLPANALGAPFAGKVYIILLSVDVVPAGSLGSQPGDTIAAEKSLRYKFRLVNNTGASVGLGDLQLNFNGVNPGANTTDPNFHTGFTFPGAPSVATDYQQIKNLVTAANADASKPVGNVEDGCGEGLRAISVTARNYNGTGDGVQGESAGALGTAITNQGYIQFQTALGVHVERGSIVVDRNTDPLVANKLFTTDPLAPAAANNSMSLGTISFYNRNVDLWDAAATGTYYKFSVKDLDGTTGNTGSVDVTGLTVKVTGTNGFAAGTKFRLSNDPSCADAAMSSAWTGATFTANPAAGLNAVDAAVAFDLAALKAAYGYVNGATAGDSLTDVTAGTPVTAPFTGPYPTDRAFLCMQVPGTALIPQSKFSAVAQLNRLATDEQDNVSCKAPLAGLGGGIKVDVRNYTEFDTANGDWTDYVRIVNNSETVTADITVQYIKADGKYGKWVSLGNLAPREAKFFSNGQIKALMAASGTESTDVNAAASGSQMLATNEQGRLRVSSDAASTLRVQNYFFNKANGALSEVSASQGADFVNIEASKRDHIDQDAQTGLKK